jgi:hypothetical protein
MVGKALKSHEARSELNSVFGLEEVDWWNPIRTSTTVPPVWQLAVDDYVISSWLAPAV